MKSARFSQTLDGGDVFSLGLKSQNHARVHGLSIQQHRTAAAIAGAASFLRAGQAHADAQGIEQPSPRRDFYRFRLIVDGEAQSLLFHGLNYSTMLDTRQPGITNSVPNRLRCNHIRFLLLSTVYRWRWLGCSKRDHQ